MFVAVREILHVNNLVRNMVTIGIVLHLHKLTKTVFLSCELLKVYKHRHTHTLLLDLPFKPNAFLKLDLPLKP